MHFIVSILQCVARILLGGSLAEKDLPRSRGRAVAYRLRVPTGDDHWPRVGWRKIRLLLEAFSGMPCRRMVLIRVPTLQQVNPRAKSVQSESFLAETSPPSYLRNRFSPPDFPGM